MRIGRTPIGIMICACSLFALGLTACGGGDDGPPSPDLRLPLDAVASTHTYEIISDPTITGLCELIYSNLGCDSSTSCMERLGVDTTGEMEIQYSDSAVRIRIVNPTPTPLPIELDFNGTRAATWFTATLNPFSMPIPDLPEWLTATATLTTTLTGGDVSSETFSGLLEAQLTIETTILDRPIPDAVCVVAASYETEQIVPADSELHREISSRESILQPTIAEDEFAELALILRALFLIE